METKRPGTAVANSSKVMLFLEEEQGRKIGTYKTVGFYN